MPARAPALYLITDRHATAGRPLVQVMAQALAGIAAAGAPGDALAVQLRERDLPGAPLLALARELRALTAAAGAALYVNDRIDVALAAGADGVHLGGGSLTPAEVSAIAPELAVAVSAHGIADLARVAGESNVRFAVLGPIFATPSKQRYGPPLGLGVLGRSLELPIPALALGGVDVQNATACRAAGAAGVACIRAVLGATDPKATVTAFLNLAFTDANTHKRTDLT